MSNGQDFIKDYNPGAEYAQGFVTNVETIDVPKDLKNKLTKEGVINLVKENWAKQSLLVSEIDTLMKDVPEGAQLTITQEQLPNGISFNSILGNGKIKPIPLSSISFSLCKNSSLKCQGNTR